MALKETIGEYGDLIIKMDSEEPNFTEIGGIEIAGRNGTEIAIIY